MNQPGNATQPWYVDQSGRRYIAMGSIGRVKCLMHLHVDGSGRATPAITSSLFLRLLYALAILPGVIVAMSIPLLPLVAVAQLKPTSSALTAALIVVCCVYTILAARCISAVRVWARSSLICLEWIAMLIGIALWSAFAVLLWLMPASL